MYVLFRLGKGKYILSKISRMERQLREIKRLGSSDK